MRDNWRKEKFENLGDILIGGTPSRNNPNFWSEENIAHLWVSIADLSKAGKIINNTKESITDAGVFGSNVKKIKKGTIIFSFKLSVGKKAIAGCDLFTNEAIAAFTFNENIIRNSFLYYGLETIDYSKVTDSAIKGVTLNKEKLKNLDITLPPLPQQQKIAQILSTCDTVLEKTEAAIAKYKAIKQGLLDDLFTRGIDPANGKLRPSYEEAPELYKETELGFVPIEWVAGNFGDYIVKNLYGPRFSANDYDKEGNVRTIRGMDFSKEGAILYNQTPIALLPVSKVNAHLLVEGDIVMVTTADCGLTAVFEKQAFNFIPSAYAVKLRFEESVNPYFIKFYMQTDIASKQVNKYVRQGTLGNLPGSDILTFILNIPEKTEQDIIVDRIKSVDQKIEMEQRSLAKYQAVKVGLMQDLLSGKIGVEKLLEKEKNPTI